VAVSSDTSDGYFDICYELDSGSECLDFDEDGSNDNVLFRIGLDRVKNAHVEFKEFDTNGYEDLCFGGLECRYDTECDEFEECFGSLKREKNSHIGDCSSYDTKICCKPGCRIDNVFWSKNGVNTVDSAEENDIVLIIVQGSEGCSEIQDVNLRVIQRNSIIDHVFSVDRDFGENGNIEYSWTADRNCDTHSLFCLSDPLFYFE